MNPCRTRMRPRLTPPAAGRCCFRVSGRWGGTGDERTGSYGLYGHVVAASSREGDEEGATTNDAMGNDGAKNHALGRPYGRDRLTQQHGRAPGVVVDRPAPRHRLRRPIASTSTGTGRRGSDRSPTGNVPRPRVRGRARAPQVVGYRRDGLGGPRPGRQGAAGEQHHDGRSVGKSTQMRALRQ